jgi:hypothetical protein
MDHGCQSAVSRDIGKSIEPNPVHHRHCLRLGFNNIPSFYKAFRSRYGVSPGEVRRNDFSANPAALSTDA